MRILVLEFASYFKDRKFLPEGQSMLHLVAGGLKRAGHQIIIPPPGNDIHSDILDLAGKIDYVLPIAPDRELLKIVKFLEENSIPYLCSDSGALEICADKWKTYLLLKEKGINTPETFLFDEFSNELASPLILKERYGSGCDGLRMIKDLSTLNEIRERDLIVQEYIQGEDASVTLFCNGGEARAVSLNKQYIEWNSPSGKYVGGEVPLEHSQAEEAFRVAESIAESIPGLRGCVGIDLILAKKLYILEINPRVTTSMIALESATGLNIGLSIVNSINGVLPEKQEFHKRVKFWKEKEGINIEEME